MHNFYLIECPTQDLLFLTYADPGTVAEILNILNRMKGAAPKYSAHLQSGILPAYKTIQLVNREDFFSQNFHRLYK